MSGRAVSVNRNNVLKPRGPGAQAVPFTTKYIDLSNKPEWCAMTCLLLWLQCLPLTL